MKIKRDELIDVLQKVRPGLAETERVEQATHFVFSDDEIITYNDQICVIYPFNSGLACSVPAAELYKVLMSVTADEIEIVLKDDKLKINAGKTKAAIVTQEGEVIFGYIETLGLNKIKSYRKLPEDFIEGMKMCHFSASRDMTDIRLTGLFVDDDAIISTDDLRISRYIFANEKGLGVTFNIPAMAVEELIKFPVVKFATNDLWAFFVTGDGIIFGARLLIKDFPDVEGYFKFSGIKVTLPEDFAKSVEIASIMTTGEVARDELIEVQVTRDVIRCKGKGKRGWIENEMEMNDKLVSPDFSFLINPYFLLMILKHTREMIYGDNRAMFKAPNFNHIMSIRSAE